MISEKTTLWRRNCADVCAGEIFIENDLREILKAFGYNLVKFQDCKEEYYQEKLEFFKKFRLIIVSLDLTDDYSDVISNILFNNLPCVFIGDSTSKPPAPLFEKLSKYFSAEVLKVAKEHSSVQIPSFGCSSSLLAFLDKERRSKYDNANSDIKKAIYEIFRVELKNQMDESGC